MRLLSYQQRAQPKQDITAELNLEVSPCKAESRPLMCHASYFNVSHVQLKPEIQYLPVTAELILETSGRGSFIAPAVGFLHYGPSCYLYDHVCNFNYQGEHWHFYSQILTSTYGDAD